MQEFTIVIRESGTSIDFIENIENIESSMNFNFDKKIILYFDKQKYQLTDEVIKQVKTLQDEGIECFYGRECFKLIDELSKDKEKIVLFMETGDTIESKYFDYLRYFFDENKEKCQVVLPDFFNMFDKNNILYLENVGDLQLSSKGVAILSNAITTSNLENYCNDFVKNLVLNNLKSSMCVGLLDSDNYTSYDKVNETKIYMHKKDSSIYFEQNNIKVYKKDTIDDSYENELLKSEKSQKKSGVLVSCIIYANGDESHFMDTLYSIEKQSLFYMNKIQIIIVNDKKLNLKNIDEFDYDKYLCIESKNAIQGINSAIKKVAGKYVTFVKTGDVLYEKHLQKSTELLDKYESINSTFNENNLNNEMIINILEESDVRLNNLSKFVFRKEIIEKNIFNKNNVFFAEIEFIHNFVIENNKVIVFKSQSVYKTDENQVSLDLLDFEHFCNIIINNSKNKFGVVTKYTCSIILDYLKGLYNNSFLNVKSYKNEVVKKILSDILQDISDEEIKKLSGVSVYFKVFLFQSKYKKLVWKNSKSLFYLTLNNEKLLVIKPSFNMTRVENKGDIVNFCGCCDLPFYDNISFNADCFGSNTIIELYEKSVDCFLSFKIHSTMEFSFDIPVEENGMMDFYLSIKIGENSQLDIDGYSCLGSSFKVTKDYIIKAEVNKNQLKIVKSDNLNIEECIKNYIDESIDNKDNKQKINLLEKYSRLYPIFSKYNIWLFIKTESSDYDNLETFFDYCEENNNKKIDKYIVRYKSNDDEIEYGSDLHRLMYLFAEKVIVSEVNDVSLNPFPGDDMKIFEPLIKRKIVYLPNSFVLENSKIEEKYKYNIDFVSLSSKKEYIENLNVNYTGRAKFDLLESDSQKIILIMPDYNVNCKNIKMDEFKDSQYCMKINELLSSEVLAKASSLYGYAVAFYPHNDTLMYMNAYKSSGSVLLLPSNTPIDDIVSQSSLLITDCNDIAFDFAYLKKPVLYYDFEKYETSDIFDYKKDGFGEVVSEHNELVNTIINYMKNGCLIKEEYLERIESFYEHFDSDNCNRLYNLMLSDILNS